MQSNTNTHPMEVTLSISAAAQAKLLALQPVTSTHCGGDWVHCGGDDEDDEGDEQFRYSEYDTAYREDWAHCGGD